MTASIFYAIKSSMFELSHLPLQILSDLVCTLETQLCIRNWQLSRTIWVQLPSPSYYLQYPRRDMCVRGTCSDPEVLRYFGAGGTWAYLANSPLNRGTSCTAPLENQVIASVGATKQQQKGFERQWQRGETPGGGTRASSLPRHTQTGESIFKIREEKNKSSFQLQIVQTMQQSNYIPPLSILPCHWHPWLSVTLGSGTQGTPITTQVLQSKESLPEKPGAALGRWESPWAQAWPAPSSPQQQQEQLYRSWQTRSKGTIVIMLV